jgi:signal transduction histidine kinase
VQRTIAATALFALGALLVTAFSSLLAYQRVRDAFARELGQRLVVVARAAASQIDPADVRDVRRFGRESDQFVGLELVFLSLLRAGGVAEAWLIDTSGVILADAVNPRREGSRTPLDSLAPAAMNAVRRGETAVSDFYRVRGATRRAAVVPVAAPEGPAVAALVAVEGEPDYSATLAQLGRTLLLVGVVSLGALALFGTLFVRRAHSAVELERQLSRAQNLATMGQMTATLAHEIRNPLGIIRNAATRLGQLDAQARQMADFVVEEVDRLHRTLNRYLEFARGGEEVGGKGDALAALQATLALLEGEMHSRGVGLQLAAMPAGPARVGLDTESLKQVYLNLILNALDAMPQGGELRVAGAERRGRYEFEIADNGVGMTAETLGKIGSPFFTTKPQGSGLGLVLTRRLLRSAGGDLRLQSAPGRGTTCTVVLPRRTR